MDQEYLNSLRHSCAHLLAKAVLELYPGAKNAIGPSIDNGFYQDFDMGDVKISNADLAKIEKKMREILPGWQKFIFNEVTLDEARKLFAHNPYKVELAVEFANQGKKLSTNDPGGFLDLCKMGHVENPSKELRHFKLQSVAGAYWRGSEKNQMLTRIYGTCWPTKQELDQYLEMIKQAEQRDHRKLGKELGLFVFSELVGPGMPLYTPKGALIRKLIVQYSDELQSSIGYERVHTPNINKAELFKISGHYDKFKDDMLEVKSHYTAEQYFLKPMNCPQHTQIYASQLRSYKDLPVRFCDDANLYRDEKPGELSGLTRLRCFSQDDGHCFCREDQIEQEFSAVLGIIKQAMETYRMQYWIRLSLSDPAHPELYLGDRAVWEKSEKILEGILKDNSIEYRKAEGEAAFYGPKMDLMARDAIGREWQISTIQLDFNMPERFGLEYVDEQGNRKRPVMIHRAIVGSPERFMAILIEHFAGAFPTWLAPVQVSIVPVSADFIDPARKLANDLRAQNVRVTLDDANETVGKRIRNGEKQKIPYLLVIGEKEAKGTKLAVRIHGQKDTTTFTRKQFTNRVIEEIAARQ